MHINRSLFVLTDTINARSQKKILLNDTRTTMIEEVKYIFSLYLIKTKKEEIMIHLTWCFFLCCSFQLYPTGNTSIIIIIDYIRINSTCLSYPWWNFLIVTFGFISFIKRMMLKIIKEILSKTKSEKFILKVYSNPLVLLYFFSN